MKLEHNPVASSNFAKTLIEVVSADYAYDKVSIMRKAMPRLDEDTRLVFRDIVSHLEANSIDVHDEFWADFNQQIKANYKIGLHEAENNELNELVDKELNLVEPVRSKQIQVRKCPLHELISIVDITMMEASGKKPTANEIWIEIERNYSDYNNFETILSVSAEEIKYKSIHTDRERRPLNYKSFDSTVSRIRRKRNI